jgi:hypothetical protein
MGTINIASGTLPRSRGGRCPDSGPTSICPIAGLSQISGPLSGTILYQVPYAIVALLNEDEFRDPRPSSLLHCQKSGDFITPKLAFVSVRVAVTGGGGSAAILIGARGPPTLYVNSRKPYGGRGKKSCTFGKEDKRSVKSQRFFCDSSPAVA